MSSPEVQTEANYHPCHEDGEHNGTKCVHLISPQDLLEPSEPGGGDPGRSPGLSWRTRDSFRHDH